MERIGQLMKRSKYNLSTRIVLLSLSTSLFSLIAYYFLSPWLHPVILGVLILLAVLIFVGVFGFQLAKFYIYNLEKLDFVLKNAINGDYSARIEHEEHDQLEEIFVQLNEFMEQVEQKLTYFQALGEARVMQEAASIEAAVLEERKRLARDLHDSVSQQLFAIHMCASSLMKLQEVNPAQAEQVMHQLVTMSSTAQKQMRKFIAHLRPMELENRSLHQALDHWFPDYCRQNEIQGNLEYRLVEPLSEAKEHQLFLIVQEAMANIVKHSQSETCRLTIYETESQVIMTIQDEGIGFKQEALSTKSYGLSTMQERAHKLSGSTEILSREGRGTLVKVTIPKLNEKEILA